MKTYSSDRSLYNETKRLSLLWYSPSGLQTFPIDEAVEQINRTHAFAPGDKTVITIHGFNDHAESPVPAAIAQAYLGKGNYNVMLLDCSPITTGKYVRAAYMTQLIGKKLAFFLQQLMDLGTTPENIHLIGNSLGAQISGWAGRYFRSKTGKTIQRITGLDPAGPCFTYADSSVRLNEGDAVFVDVIHVNRGIQGILEKVGHADFFVNGGGPNQPGCMGPNCSHMRAALLYAESIISDIPFYARRCDSWDGFVNSKCNSNRLNFMGFNSTGATKGKFFMRTAGEEPYSLGLSGANPEKKGFFSFFKNLIT